MSANPSEVLDLSKSGLKDAQVPVLVLRQLANQKSLILTQNPITNDGVEILANWLCSYENFLPLFSLDLSQCQVTGAGALGLLDAPLTELNLSNNGIFGTVFAERLAQKIRTHRLSILLLDLRGNQLTPEEQQIIIDAIKHSHCKTRIWFESDPQKQALIDEELDQFQAERYPFAHPEEVVLDSELASQIRQKAASERAVIRAQQQGALPRDFILRTLQFCRPRDWIKLRSLNRYYRSVFPFEWHTLGPNIRSYNDFVRWKSHATDLKSLLDGQTTLHDLPRLQKNPKVDQYLATLPAQSDALTLFHEAEELDLIDYAPEHPTGSITRTCAEIYLKGYLGPGEFDFPPHHESRKPQDGGLFPWGYDEGKKALLTLFEEGYLPFGKPAETSKYALLINAIAMSDPKITLYAFRKGLITADDLLFDTDMTYAQMRALKLGIVNPDLKKYGVNSEPGWYSIPEFIFSPIGIEALTKGWITRKNIQEVYGDLKSLLYRYLLNRYAPAVQKFSHTLPRPCTCLPLRVLDVLLSPKYANSMLRTRLFNALRDPQFATGPLYHEYSVDLSCQEALDLAPVFADGILESERSLKSLFDQLNDQTRHGVNVEIGLMFLVQGMSKPRSELSTPQQLARQEFCAFLGHPDIRAALKDKTLTLTHISKMIEVGDLPAKRVAIQNLYHNHHISPSQSPVGRDLAGVKQELSKHLKYYLDHRAIFHRERAELLKTTLEQAENFDVLCKFIQGQIELYNPRCQTRFRMPAFNKIPVADPKDRLWISLNHKTKGYVNWTYHKALLRCQKALKDYQDQHENYPRTETIKTLSR